MGRTIVNEKVKIPVEIKLVKDPKGKGKLKATVPMNVMFDKDFDAKWLEEALVKFERGYFYLRFISNLVAISKGTFND